MRWFDNQSRTSKILNLLERKVRITPEELKTRLGVSIRTVKNDINQLNEQLGDSANIELKNGNYQLFILNITDFLNIKNQIEEPANNFEIPENRMAYISDVLFNSPEYVLIDDLAFDISVSRTTLINDLAKLRKILSKYNLIIEGKPNTGLKIQGKEYAIRRFILENTYNLLFDQNYLDKDIEEEIDAVMRQYTFDAEIQKIFKRYLTLSLDRFLNGFEIAQLALLSDSLKKHPFREVTKKVKKILQKKMNINLSEMEELFLLLPLVGMRIPVNINSIDDFIEIDQETIELIDKILDVVKEETDINFSFDESLEEFIYHVYFLFQRLKYQIYIENPVKEEMKEKYGFAWSIAEHIAKLIEKETGNHVSDDEIGFLTAYYALFIQNYQNTRKDKFKVLVIHQKGGATRRLITYELKKVLSDDVLIDAIANTSNLESIIDEYDLIIATDHLELKTDQPVIELDEIIDENKLRKQIDKITYTHGINIPSNTFVQSIVLNLLDETKILKLDKTSTYEEALEILSDKANDLNLIDQGFKNRLLEREKKATMKFSENLAFPHTIHYKGNEPFLLMGLAPEGLKESPDLKVIFLAGLPRESQDDITLVHLYEEIVKIAENSENVINLSKLDNYHDVLNFFIIEQSIFE